MGAARGDGLPSGPPPADNIPEELRARPQWVVWCHETRNGKGTKVRYNAKSSSVKASATDPETWSSFRLAVSTSKMEDIDGIGFVFAEGDPYTGVDLDECFDEHGELHPDAARIVDMLGSWAERSPSRTGLHVIVRADLNGRPRNPGRAPWGGEFYSQRRFFTVTGAQLEDTPDTVEDRQAELDAVLAEFLPAEPVVDTPPVGTSERSDNEVLARAFAARNGTKVLALYRGDRTGYGSESEADQALLSALAFWTRDAHQLDRLFRDSGLMRDKWERQDYRERTISKALAGGKAFDWDTQPKPTRALEEFTDLTVERILDDADDEATSELKELSKLLAQKDSVATQIVTLVEESGAVLFHDPDQIAYAAFDVDGHTETHAMRSRAFKLWLRRRYHENHESAPNGTALGDAVGVLEGRAIFDGRPCPFTCAWPMTARRSLSIRRRALARRAHRPGRLEGARSPSGPLPPQRGYGGAARARARRHCQAAAGLPERGRRRLPAARGLAHRGATSRLAIPGGKPRRRAGLSEVHRGRGAARSWTRARFPCMHRRVTGST